VLTAARLPVPVAAVVVDQPEAVRLLPWLAVLKDITRPASGS
jgi:hypothetical protein